MEAAKAEPELQSMGAQTPEPGVKSVQAHLGQLGVGAQTPEPSHSDMTQPAAATVASETPVEDSHCDDNPRSPKMKRLGERWESPDGRGGIKGKAEGELEQEDASDLG